MCLLEFVLVLEYCFVLCCHYAKFCFGISIAFGYVVHATYPSILDVRPRFYRLCLTHVSCVLVTSPKKLLFVDLGRYYAID